MTIYTYEIESKIYQMKQGERNLVGGEMHVELVEHCNSLTEEFKQLKAENESLKLEIISVYNRMRIKNL